MADVFVVVVDAFERGMIEKMLVGLGYEVVVAGDGQEALQRIREKPFQVVIPDLMMPLKSGFEAIKKVRRHDLGIKVIAFPLCWRSSQKYGGKRFSVCDPGPATISSAPP